ncbi:hypothetical protein IQ06DRAFT_350098 [Phaeosphaeriaceae sp. SRC1lsM3a]|nr:hypothetical protein IQ06DRAFT_350098 [Stagonospora sp. SRC1lsM3a]
MFDWNFIDRFGKDAAKSAGTTKRSFWLTAMTGYLPHVNARNTKDSFSEEEVNGFSDRLKKWIRAHPTQVATLLGMHDYPSRCSHDESHRSIAASIQATAGPLAAGSALAILQSAGAGGYGLIVVKTIAASGTLAATCSAAAMSFLRAMKEEQCKRDQNEES